MTASRRRSVLFLCLVGSASACATIRPELRAANEYYGRSVSEGLRERWSEVAADPQTRTAEWVRERWSSSGYQERVVLFNLMVAYEPSATAMVSEIVPMHVSTAWSTEAARDESLDREFLDQVVLLVRGIGLSVSVAPEVPDGTKWRFEQALDFVDQGAIMDTDMHSIICGGDVRISNSEFELVGVFSNQDGSGSIDPAVGYRRAVKSLAEALVVWIMKRVVDSVPTLPPTGPHRAG